MERGLAQGEQAAERAELGAALQSRATELAQRWRRLLFQGDVQHAAERTALLQDVAEPLLFEAGRQLASGAAGATAPWSRCTGLLRLSPARGVTGLDEEFAVLQDVVEAFAAALDAPLAARRRLRTYLEAARLLSRAELARKLDPLAPRPAAPFGGVVVELYERALWH